MTAASPSSSGLALECFETLAGGPSTGEEWDAFVDRSGAEIYFLTAWQQAWWNHYGPGFAASRKSACLLLRDGPEIVGALPFCIETFRVGPVRARIARLAGVDPNFAVVTLPITPGYESAVLKAAFDHLVNSLSCVAISLSPLSDRSAQLSGIRLMGDAMCILRDHSARGHTLMDLPDSPTAFMAALSKSRRREVRRDLKRLAEAGELRNVTSEADGVDAVMDRFVDLHTQQWQAAGKGGHFADWRVTAAFYRELLHRLAPQGQAAIDEQWLGDALLSSQLRYASGTKAYWWLNARSMDPRFEKIGLGRVGLVERAGALIASGVRLVEAGAGEYEYKLSYGGELVPVHSIVLAPDRGSARRRARALLFWADVLNLFYYRIWFLKLRPRLGLPPRALWTSWIRTRL